VVGGDLDGVQGVHVLLREGQAQSEVHAVPHLSGCVVLLGGSDVVASSPLHARQLVLSTGSVHEEAHASSEVGFCDGAVL